MSPTNLKFAFLLYSAMAVSPMSAFASNVYDSTGGTENGGDLLTGGAGMLLFNRVYVGSGTQLASVQVNVMRPAGAKAGQICFVAATVSMSGLPYGTKTLGCFSTGGIVADGQFHLMSIPSSFFAAYPLKTKKSYFFGLKDGPVSARSHLVIGNTIDPRVLARPSVVAGGTYFNQTGGLQANAGGPYEMSVNTSP